MQSHTLRFLFLSLTVFSLGYGIYNALTYDQPILITIGNTHHCVAVHIICSALYAFGTSLDE